MSALPAGGPHSNSSPRPKRVTTPKPKPERDERDTDIDRLEMDNQFLKDLLQKAKTERESLLEKISHMEQQMKVQESLVIEAQQQRNTEQKAFRRNVENARTVLDSKYSKVQNTLKERESLLLLWTEYATATLIETQDSPIRPLLLKTCTALPAAKELAGKIYEHFLEVKLTAGRGETEEADIATTKETNSDRDINDNGTGTGTGTGATNNGTVPIGIRTSYERLMGIEPAAGDLSLQSRSPSRGMTACLRDINSKVDGATQKINALLDTDTEQDGDHDPATDTDAGTGTHRHHDTDTDGNRGHAGDRESNATEAILGGDMTTSASASTSRSPTKGQPQFLSDGPGSSSSDEGGKKRVRIVDGQQQQGQGQSPKKMKKKIVKKKKAKSEKGTAATGGLGGGSPRPKVDFAATTDMNSLSQNSSIDVSTAHGDKNPANANFWWQGNSGAGTGTGATQQQRDAFNTANDKSISFSDAEINRLLQELRIQQQQQGQGQGGGDSSNVSKSHSKKHRANQGKHSMNLGSDNDDEDEEE